MKYRIVLKNQAERDLRQIATDLLEYRSQDTVVCRKIIRSVGANAYDRQEMSAQASAFSGFTPMARKAI
jgi:hypothetical protein